MHSRLVRDAGVTIGHSSGLQGTIADVLAMLTYTPICTPICTAPVDWSGSGSGFEGSEMCVCDSIRPKARVLCSANVSLCVRTN